MSNPDLSDLVWLNGSLVAADQARIDPADRGFLLGDGVFETIRVTSKHAVWLDDHLDRLRRSAQSLDLPVPLDDRSLSDGLATLIAAQNHNESAIRLTVTRGPGRLRGIWPPGEVGRPTILATLAPLSPPQLDGSRAGVVAKTTRRNEHSPLSRIKSLSYGDAIIARQEAASRGAAEALLLNTAGHLACAAVGNVFVRIDGAWLTPRLEDGILPGLARARILPLVDAAELPITAGLLARAEAVMVSNSLGLTSLGSLDGRALEPVNTLPLADRIFSAAYGFGS